MSIVFFFRSKAFCFWIAGATAPPVSLSIAILLLIIKALLERLIEANLAA
jgi:hypothetical protein